MAKALRRELGNSHAAVKTVAQWTGASERAAKNWLAGRFAPSGEHLVSLVERSNEVLFVFLILAHRHDVATAAVLVDVRDRLRAASLAVDRILGNDREEG
ncbi:XRE family transcriptional regulator [Methylobacterium aquaticum]|nr:XRE family transcriptional regulator [Methylobacterium aquaticum]